MKLKKALEKLGKAKTAAKVGLLMGRVVFTGTVSKTLKDVGTYIELGEKFVEDLRKIKEPSDGRQD